MSGWCSVERKKVKRIRTQENSWTRRGACRAQMGTAGTVKWSADLVKRSGGDGSRQPSELVHMVREGQELERSEPS